MAENYFMGLDYGTQSVRCGVFDKMGASVVVSEEKYETFYPNPGWAEQRPSDWIKCTRAVVDSCYLLVGAEVFNMIRGISICSTASTVVAVDHDDSPIGNAILWMDIRAAAQMQRINRTKHEILRHCGNEVSAEWFVPKMMWIRDEMPEVFNNAKMIIELQDYMNHYLTGRWRASISQVVCKANYVEDSGGFQRDFFETIGFPEFFDKANLEVLRQADNIGPLRSSLAKEFKLNSDVQVYQGAIDAYTNMIGLGICKPGVTGVVMGTSFVHLALSPHPIYNDGVWGPYKDAIVPGGYYCLEGGQVSAASISKWFLREFGVDGVNPYGDMAQEAEGIPIGSDGLITLDFFQGNRTPYKDPQAKGVFFGLTLSHTRGHIYRSIMESVAFGTLNVLNTMEKGELTINEIRGCGGVTLNKMWLQIIADVTGKPIILTENPDKAGVLGCAITACVGYGGFERFDEACSSMVKEAGRIEPSPQAHQQYIEYYEKYLALYDNLKHLMKN